MKLNRLSHSCSSRSLYPHRVAPLSLTSRGGTNTTRLLVLTPTLRADTPATPACPTNAPSGWSAHSTTCPMARSSAEVWTNIKSDTQAATATTSRCDAWKSAARTSPALRPPRQNNANHRLRLAIRDLHPRGHADLEHFDSVDTHCHQLSQRTGHLRVH